MQKLSLTSAKGSAALLSFAFGLLSLGFEMVLCPVAQCQTEPKKEAPAPVIASEIKGMPPRAAPTDYQVQAKVGAVTLAADFDGHAVPTLEAAYSSEEYIVVELAFFGEPEARLKLSIEDFSLKINDRKAPFTSQPFGYVARTLKDPEWQPPEEPEKKSKTSLNGSGNDSSTAPPPKMPMELRRVMELRVHKSVLPEGDRALPVAGLIFFQYRGKEQNIKSMELVYNGPAGTVSLPLHP
jgi:hypothetical protein